MKILVCHDCSESARSALEKCVALFAHLRPQVILVAVIEEALDASSHAEQAFQERQEQMDAQLKQEAQRVSELGFDVNVILAVGDSRKMLMAAIENARPDLVVIASRPPRGGIRFGNVSVSVSDYLLRHIDDCPVLLMS